MSDRVFEAETSHRETETVENVEPGICFFNNRNAALNVSGNSNSSQPILVVLPDTCENECVDDVGVSGQALGSQHSSLPTVNNPQQAPISSLSTCLLVSHIFPEGELSHVAKETDSPLPCAESLPLDSEDPCKLNKNGRWIESINMIKYRMIHLLAVGFSRYAEVVYVHAWKFIIGCFLVTSLLGIGLLYRRSECQMYKLYSLPNTPSQHAKRELLDTFNPQRITLIFATSEEDSLSKGTLIKLDELNAELQSIVFNKTDVTDDEFGNPLTLTEAEKDIIPDTITYHDVCVRDAWNECSQSSILQVYFNEGFWGRAIVSRDYPTVFNIKKRQAFRIDSLAGNITLEERVQGGREMTIVRNATAFALRHDFTGADTWVHYSAAYEKKVQDLVKKYTIDGMNLSFRTERSINDELNRASRMDLPDQIRLLVAVCLVVAYCVATNTSCSYRSKSWVALMGVVAALLGYLGGTGVLHLFGLLHTPPAEATPFLVIGIGVDDMFVMLNAFSLTYPYSSGRERLKITVRDAGISITITTITNIIAFIIGAVSPYFSVSRFCIITASSLLMGYVACLTFFLGWLALDARREERHHLTYFSSMVCTMKNKKKYTDFRVVSNKPEDIHKRIEQRCNSSTVEELQNDQEDLTVCTIGTSGDYNSNNSSNVSGSSSIVSSHDEVTTYSLVTKQLLKADKQNYAKRRHHKSYRPSIFSRVRGLSENTTGECNMGGPDSTGASKSERRLKSDFAKFSTGSHTLSNIDSYSDIPTNTYHPPTIVSPSSDLDSSEEPMGNIGRLNRKFLLLYYGRWLSNIWIKILVILVFIVYILGAIYGLTHLNSGLALVDVTPDHSYLRDFYETRDKYFTSYGEEVTVFFPRSEEWWNKDMQDLILGVKNRVNESDYCVFLVGSLTAFIDDNQDVLVDGDKEIFHEELYNWLAGKGRSYRSDILFDSNGTIATWKLYYWMPYVDNTRISYYWLQDVKNILEEHKDAFYARAYTPLSVMWESDPKILEYTLTNMAIALFAIILVAALSIPDLVSAVLVVMMIVMVDLGLFGYMTYWNLELNMLTMVNLLISIGFSVDYTAHMVHTFAHCVGSTRNERMIETLVIMGTPVTHGMISTLLAVIVLSTADKHALIVFFQMITMVLIFAFAHGVILLPVLLSLFGPMPKRKMFT